MINSSNDHRLQASILIADIRNFTPNLKDSEASQTMHNIFHQFLSDFYSCCVACCTLACGSDDKKSLYINSTGDGILSVFLSRRHYMDAFLAGIILFNKLPALFDKYNRRKHKRISDVSFGIGIESGNVWRVTSDSISSHQPAIETYIGDCINIASRVESVTKEHDRTTLIISEQIDELLCEQLCGAHYHDLMKDATNFSLPAGQRKRIWEKMYELDERLLLRFISAYNLRGVSKPVRLFRLSPTLATPARKECQKVLKGLAVDASHYQSINQFLKS
jgi:class 3 adenylate cyclase